MSLGLLSPLESFLLSELKKANAVDGLLVAFSGGLDSKVLLHCLYRLQLSGQVKGLRAVHVNHGLQALADDWQEACGKDCANYGIALTTESLKLGSDLSARIESLAREGRYQVFKDTLQLREVLLLAHHQDDQAETVLLRLLRGSGLKGVAAIPKERALGENRLLRPFLSVSRSELEDYAKLNRLDWIDDPSNQANQYSRNFLRNRILPLVKARWPSYAKTFTRFSQVAAEQCELLAEVAFEDFNTVSARLDFLVIDRLGGLSVSRQKNLLYYWIKSLSGLPPSNKEIDELLIQLSASMRRSIKVKLSTGLVRSFAGKLYFCHQVEPEPLPNKVSWNQLGQGISLSRQLKVTVEPAKKEGVRLPLGDEVVWVDARRGGERCCPNYRHHSADLKKIYQELGVPPWQRKWLPIIYYNEQIVAVPGVFISKTFVSNELSSAIGFVLNRD